MHNPSMSAEIKPVGPGSGQVSILFVCLGNICRSPAAQAIFDKIASEKGISGSVVSDSAGIYGGHAGQMPDRRMREHAFVRGYRLDHRSRPVAESDFFDFDIIVAMDDSNYSSLRKLAPTPETESKVVRMISYARRHPEADCVPDPYYEGAEGFEIVLDLLEDACLGLADHILKNTPGISSRKNDNSL